MGLYTGFSFAADVSSEHDGYELGFDVGKEFEAGSFATPSLKFSIVNALLQAFLTGARDLKDLLRQPYQRT